MPFLIWLFGVPFITAAAAFLCPDLPRANFKRLAVIMSLIPLLILLYGHYEWIGSSVNYAWIPALSINFHLSVDAISLVFLYLSAIVIPISLLAMPSKNLEHPHMFYGTILLLQALLIGFFTARDLALFTLFWESMLIPLYFIINIWGGQERKAASLKFLIYMIAGSALMVAAVLALYFDASASSGTGTFNLDILSKTASNAPHAIWLFAIFLLAFAVKTPLFPFHAWLPDAYCQAPTTGTILLAGLLSKAGIYGILRIGMGLFPSFIQSWGPSLLILAIIGVLYGALAAWMQNDYKRLIAYSSFSHVNLILVGLFVWNATAHTGALLQAFNHGITITALFLVAGWLEERLGSTKIAIGSGLCKYLPQLCWLTLFFVLSSVALPGLNNFIGEFLIFFGLFGQNPWLAALLGISIILSVVYMLRWMQKVYFEAPTLYQESYVDIKAKELLIALPLIILILWVGIYPAPILKQIAPAAEKTVVVANLENPI